MATATDIHPKVAGATFGGSLALVILAIVGHWVDIPPEVAAAVTVLVTSVCGYFSPQKKTP